MNLTAGISLGIALLTLLRGLSPFPPGPGSGDQSSSASFQVVHQGFEAFSLGQFEQAGQNIYVSRKGRVQLIHRWDLNNDGYYEFVFSNTHNVMVGGVDALGYLQTPRGFRSAVSQSIVPWRSTTCGFRKRRAVRLWCVSHPSSHAPSPFMTWTRMASWIFCLRHQGQATARFLKASSTGAGTWRCCPGSCSTPGSGSCAWPAWPGSRSWS